MARVAGMRVVIGVLVVLHLLGAAAIIGPWLAAPRSGRIRMAMVWGARAQLVTGILLVGLASGVKDDDFTVDNTKIAVKLVVVLVITVLLFLWRRRPTITRGMLMTIGGLTLLNAIIAVFWH